MKINDLTNSICNLPLNKEITESENSDNETDSISNLTKLKGLLPKLHSKIVYHNPDTQSWIEALVLGEAGKSTGKNKTWLNIKNLRDNSHQSVDFFNKKCWKNVEEEVNVINQNQKILTFSELNQQNLKIGKNIVFMKKLMILDKQQFPLDEL